MAVCVRECVRALSLCASGGRRGGLWIRLPFAVTAIGFTPGSPLPLFPSHPTDRQTDRLRYTDGGDSVMFCENGRRRRVRQKVKSAAVSADLWRDWFSVATSQRISAVAAG